MALFVELPFALPGSSNNAEIMTTVACFNKLDGVGPVDNRPPTKKQKKHVTPDT